MSHPETPPAAATALPVAATQAQVAAGQVKPEDLATIQAVVFNNQSDAALGLGLIVVVGLIVAESVRQWILLFSGRANRHLAESPTVLSRSVETHLPPSTLAA